MFCDKQFCNKGVTSIVSLANSDKNVQECDATDASWINEPLVHYRRFKKSFSNQLVNLSTYQPTSTPLYPPSIAWQCWRR